MLIQVHTRNDLAKEYLNLKDSQKGGIGDRKKSKSDDSGFSEPHDQPAAKLKSQLMQLQADFDTQRDELQKAKESGSRLTAKIRHNQSEIDEKDKNIAQILAELSTAKEQVEIAQKKSKSNERDAASSREHREAIQNLKSKLFESDQKFEDYKIATIKQFDDKSDKLVSEHRSAISQLQNQHADELLKAQHDFKKLHGNENKEFAKQALKDAEDKFRLEKTDLIEQLSKLKKNTDSEKKLVDREVYHLKESLKNAEQSLLTLKKSNLIETERLQERMGELAEQARNFDFLIQEKTNQYQSKIKQYEEKNTNYLTDVDTYQSERDQARTQLSQKERELNRTVELHQDSLKDLNDSHDELVADLRQNLEECKNTAASLEKTIAETQSVLELNESKTLLAQSSAEAEKNRAQQAMYDLHEVHAETQEQVVRTQKRMEDIRKDCEMYRGIIELQEEELLVSKRQIRQLERDNSSAIAESSGDAMKRMLEQKNVEIDKARLESRKSVARIIDLEKVIDLKNRLVEDASKEIRRRAGLQGDDLADELDRLQIILLDLKTSRVLLLEQVDDLEFNQSNLELALKRTKSELTQAKSKLQDSCVDGL